MSVVGDQQLLREILMREIETIHRYQEMLRRAADDDLQRFIAHALLEEKEHVAEAIQILRRLDPMQARALDEDHSSHFRAGGPGDRALSELLGRAGPPASPKAAPAEVAPAEAATPAESADAPPFGAVRPGTDLSARTVGSLRQES
ncbi:MAG: hypothetical protein ACF8XB_19530 [Planctomycetota bacterium JB042]